MPYHSTNALLMICLSDFHTISAPLREPGGMLRYRWAREGFKTLSCRGGRSQTWFFEPQGGTSGGGEKQHSYLTRPLTPRGRQIPSDSMHGGGRSGGVGNGGSPCMNEVLELEWCVHVCACLFSHIRFAFSGKMWALKKSHHIVHLKSRTGSKKVTPYSSSNKWLRAFF